MTTISSTDATARLLRAAIGSAVAGEHLGPDAMRDVVDAIMAGGASPAQIGALLTALRMKGETVDELVGTAQALRARMLRVESPGPVVDTCGTGGDGADLFNVSTAVALVVAGAGVAVAKHGNRAQSGRVGGADVLETLGVRIDLAPEGVTRCLARARVGFCFAPRFHGAMRFAAGPRREIGLRTIFNFVGPLANPIELGAPPSLRSRDCRHFLIFWRAWNSRVLTVPSGQFCTSATSARRSINSSGAVPAFIRWRHRPKRPREHCSRTERTAERAHRCDDPSGALDRHRERGRDTGPGCQ